MIWIVVLLINLMFVWALLVSCEFVKNWWMIRTWWKKQGSVALVNRSLVYFREIKCIVIGWTSVYFCGWRFSKWCYIYLIASHWRIGKWVRFCLLTASHEFKHFFTSIHAHILFELCVLREAICIHLFRILVKSTDTFNV